MLVDDRLDCTNSELVVGFGSEGNPNRLAAKRFEGIAVAGVTRFGYGNLVACVETGEECQDKTG